LAVRSPPQTIPSFTALNTNPLQDDTNEGTDFASNASSPAEVATFFTDNYPHLTTTDTNAINAEYPLMPPLPDHAAYFPSAAAAYGESTFTCPGIFITDTYATHVSPYKVWNYRYNLQSEYLIQLGVGVVHTLESTAIFGLGNVNDSPSQDADYGYSTYNEAIIPVVMNYWISFVRDLSPNRYKFASAPHWESFGDGHDGARRIRLQTNATAMELIPQDQLARCEFWKGLGRVMEE
jgi:acetylcholinesterase